MKKSAILTILVFLFISLKGQQYNLSGILTGAKDGVVVKLYDLDNYPEKIIDSTVVKNEKFVFKGKLNNTEKFCRIFVDETPLEKNKRMKKIKRYDFFATNSAMSFSCAIGDMPSYYYEPVSKYSNVIFTGSNAQDIYLKYVDMTDVTERQRSELFEDYLKIYHRPALYGIFNTELGIENIREKQRLAKKIDDMTKKFIAVYDTSVVSVFLANKLLMSSRTKLTAEEIDNVVSQFKETPKMKHWLDMLKKTASDEKKLAKGNSYYDIVLKDEQQQEVKLSQYVQKGKYTFLEFWASWCPPCRGEIPHLKHLYSFVPKDKLAFVSISLDERASDWKKALKAEEMTWAQLCDDKGFNGPAGENYKLDGVPYSILLDPQGKIIASGFGLRGADLDLKLIEIFGEDVFKGM